MEAKADLDGSGGRISAVLASLRAIVLVCLTAARGRHVILAGYVLSASCRPSMVVSRWISVEINAVWLC